MPKKKKSSARAAAVAVEIAVEDDFQSDVVTALGRCARNADERQATMTEALNRWAGEDIGRLERIDATGKCGWSMSRFKG